MDSSASEKRRLMPKSLTKLYVVLIKTMDKIVIPILPKKFYALYEAPAGPKTVFFWAPLFKWSLVIAGLGDLARPVETISIYQCGSLAVTGIIWSRYSLVIIPKNYSLFAVNVFVALTQLVQLGRAYKQQIYVKALENKDK